MMRTIKNGEVEGLKDLARRQREENERLSAALREIAFSNKTKTGLKEMARKALGFVS